MSIHLDPAAGIATIGEHQVPIRLYGAAGALQIGGDDGPVLGPLTFSERTRLVAYAAAARTPQRAVGQLIADAARSAVGLPASQQERRAHADPSELITAIIAMTLAGANEPELPAFGEAALLVAQATGWSPAQLAQADAVEVDRLAKLIAPSEDDGWTRLVFHKAAETDLVAIHDMLAANLLVRLQPTGVMQQPSQSTSPTAVGSSRDDSPSLAAPGAPAADLSAASASPSALLTQPGVTSSGSPSGNLETAMDEAVAGQSPGTTALPSLSRERLSAPLVTAHQPTLPSAAPALRPRFTYRLRSDRRVLAPPAPSYQQPVPTPDTAPLQSTAVTATPAAPTWPVSNPSRSAWLAGEAHPHALPSPTLDTLVGAAVGAHVPGSEQRQADPAAGGQQEAVARPVSPVVLQDLIDELAARLHLEADLRGIDR